MNDPKAKQMSAAGRKHALLVARTRRLARPRKAPTPVKSVSCLICEAGLELYAFPLAAVTRVISATRLAAVPTVNPALIGVTTRAGAFYHVYDLARLVGQGSGAASGHFILLRGAPPVALRVDQALRVADLVELPAADTSGMRADLPALTGFARALQADLFEGRTISLLDPSKLASDQTSGRVEGN